MGGKGAATVAGAAVAGAAVAGAAALIAGLIRRSGPIRSIGAGRRRIAGVATGSPQFSGGGFVNRLPPSDIPPAGSASLVLAMLRRDDRGRPTGPVPLGVPAFPDAAGLAATWLGHATVLLEVDGRRVLTDPVFGERVSPSRSIGPRRLHPVPVPLAQLPELDVILISHDHYDHLDRDTVCGLLRTQHAPFVVPLGVGRHLAHWGVPAGRIVELDWDGAAEICGLRITCTEARHFSGRALRRNTTLWSTWVVAGPRHRVFFGGDTGPTPAFDEIGRRHGPFDLTVLPIGAYDRRWPDIHLNPEQAAGVHAALRGAVLLPIHWATFDLAFHPWGEPVRRLLAAAGGIKVLVPRPGERRDLGDPLPRDRWWAVPGGGD